LYFLNPIFITCLEQQSQIVRHPFESVKDYCCLSTVAGAEFSDEGRASQSNRSSLNAAAYFFAYFS